MFLIAKLRKKILINNLFLNWVMEDEMIIEIIKWVMIVFIAGFIGYFGKHLGKNIIARFSKKQKQEASQCKHQ